MNQREKLEERLKEFSIQVLNAVKTLPYNEENKIYGRQVIRSSSSIGANYAEAIYAHSRQDFLHNINICRKEASETSYWLEMLSTVNRPFQSNLFPLLDESKQILRIFISSVKTTKENKKR